MEFTYNFFGQLKEMCGPERQYNVMNFETALKKTVINSNLDNLELKNEFELENIVERARYNSIILGHMDNFSVYSKIQPVDSPKMRDFVSRVLDVYEKLD